MYLPKMPNNINQASAQKVAQQKLKQDSLSKAMNAHERAIGKHHRGPDLNSKVGMVRK